MSRLVLQFVAKTFDPRLSQFSSLFIRFQNLFQVGRSRGLEAVHHCMTQACNVGKADLALNKRLDADLVGLVLVDRSSSAQLQCIISVAELGKTF